MNQQNNQGANQAQPLIANSVETESLADLPLTAAQAEGTKAGIAGGTAAAAGEFPYIISFQDTAAGLLRPPTPQGLVSNHNETVAEDAEGSGAAMIQLADLPLTAAQAEETKAGDGSSASIGQWPWQLSMQRL